MKMLSCQKYCYPHGQGSLHVHLAQFGAEKGTFASLKISLTVEMDKTAKRQPVGITFPCSVCMLPHICCKMYFYLSAQI